MKKKIQLVFFICAVAIFGGAAFLHAPDKHPAISALIAGKINPNQALSLIVEPDNGTVPVLSMIENAKQAVDLVIYELSDRDVERALASASARGIAVRVLLNHGYYGAESKANLDAFNYFKANNVSVQWTHSSFALTHQKTLIIDKNEALIMTFNLTPKYYAKDRDFGVIDTDATDVSAIEAAFDSDWQGTKITAQDGDDLIWSPGSEGELISLIGSAKQSLLIYNEEMNDVNIKNAILSVAKRGVKTEIVMTYSSEWKKAFDELTLAGVSIHTFSSSTKAPLYIHAKMILVDNSLAFLGSENFSAGSLNNNRELGILLSKPDIISGLTGIFQRDWVRAAEYRPATM